MPHLLVTGAAGHLGSAVVCHFLDRGWTVDGSLHRELPPGRLPVSDRLRLTMADLSGEQHAEDWVRDAVDTRGALQAAVLTAGGFAAGGLEETGSADLLRMYRLNLETAYHVARPVFSAFRKQGSGRLFLIGARAGMDMKQAGHALAYGLSKSLLFRLAEWFRAAAGPLPVYTHVLVPGIIDTPDNRAAMPGADHSSWTSPAEMAACIGRICEDSAPGEEVILF